MPGALLFLVVFICSLASSNVGGGKHILFSASMFYSPSSSAVFLFKMSEKYSTHLSVIFPPPAISFPLLVSAEANPGFNFSFYVLFLFIVLPRLFFLKNILNF
jgi:hypothetical protein